MEESIAYASNPHSSQSKTTLCDPCETNEASEFSELFTGDSLLELCNSFWTLSPNVRRNIQPYLRGCKWSPDGTCCLSVVNHDGFHVMELPRDLYEGCPRRDRMITSLPAVIHVKESGLVYDFCWYPKMNSHYPESCCWISTKINSPIQMWDAYNGSLRCSYRGFNAVDEMEPALSVTFINQGERIVGGYKNCLRTFDVERPGREFLEHKTKSPASCFATHGNMLAVGSWNANIKLFSILDNGTYRSVGNLHAHTGGITHLQFTPDGSKLVSGARKDHNLCVWDIRYHRRPLNILKRSVSTNQRIYFDISACGRYLVSGGTDGVVRVWDDKFTKWTEEFNVKQANQENATFRFQLYRDCCNSISIHPSRPILATGSGQFHFLDPVKVLDLEHDNNTNCENSDTIKPHSVSNGSSSDEQILGDTDDGNFTKVHQMDIANNVENNKQNVRESTPSEPKLKDSTKFTDKISDQDIGELSSLKLIELETITETIPLNQSLVNNDISCTIKNDITPVEINASPNKPILDICHVSLSNVEHTDEEPPTKRKKLNDDTNHCSTDMYNVDDKLLDKETLSSNQKTDTVVKATSVNVKSCNTGESDIKDNIDVRSPMNGTNTDEASTVPNEKYIEESNNFHKPILQVPKGNIDSQIPAKFLKLNEVVLSSTNISDEAEKPPDSKCIIDNLGSEEDYNDINENKMKYSSHAENNLTFWWIDKIVESQIT